MPVAFLGCFEETTEAIIGKASGRDLLRSCVQANDKTPVNDMPRTTDERSSTRFVARDERHRRTQLRWSVGASGAGGWLEHRVLAGSVDVSGLGRVFADRQKPGQPQGATADQRRLGLVTGFDFSEKGDRFIF